MPKMRLIIYSISEINKHIPHTLLYKDIEYVIINNIKYYKKDYKKCMEIENFYFNIKNNIDYITEIKLFNAVIYRIKNRFLHSFIDYSLEDNSVKRYYIYGKMIIKDKWIIESRKYKIKNILNKKPT